MLSAPLPNTSRVFCPVVSPFCVFCNVATPTCVVVRLDVRVSLLIIYVDIYDPQTELQSYRPNKVFDVVYPVFRPNLCGLSFCKVQFVLYALVESVLSAFLSGTTSVVWSAMRYSLCCLPCFRPSLCYMVESVLSAVLSGTTCVVCYAMR